MNKRSFSTGRTRRTEVYLSPETVIDVDVLAVRVGGVTRSELIERLLRRGVEWAEEERARSGSSYASVVGIAA